MTPAKKDSPPQEKSSTAKPASASGGGEVQSTDWREQTDPHPQPPGTGPAPPAKPAGRAAPITPAAAPLPPGAPYVAGTPVTVTPYRTPGGNGSFFMVGTVLCGSEEDAVISLKNQLFLPSIPPVVAGP